jgi:hypothetical protein
MSDEITIFAGPPIRNALAATGDVPDRATQRLNDIAERYLKLVAAYMPEFTLGEWGAIMDAPQALRLSGEQLLQLGASAFVASQLDPALGVSCFVGSARDSISLAERVRALSRVEALAMVEAIERFRALHTSPTAEALAACGVRIRADFPDRPRD